MKAFSVIAVVVAGFLAAAGYNNTLVQQEKQEKAKTCCQEKEKGACCSEKAAAVTVAAKEGKSCCSGGKCCGDKAKATVQTVSIKQEKEKKACCGTCDSKKTTTVSIKQEKTAKQEKSAKKTCCGVTDKAGNCVVCTEMKKLPKMTFTVAGKDVCCPTAAATLAKEKSAPIHYVVAKKTFEDKGKAMAALTSETEKMVKAFTSCHKCEKSGKTFVAGKACGCEVKAAGLAKIASEAAKTVSMKMVVGKKECNCPVTAAKLAKETDSKVEYVVGKTKTCCETTAKLTLARAKYKAAVMAIAKAEKKTTEVKK